MAEAIILIIVGAVLLKDNEYIRLRTEIIKMCKYADKHGISLRHYYDVLKENMYEDVYGCEKALRYTRWREEMESIDPDYRNKVWTEEWQKENLKRKYYYSGLPVVDEEITDENSFFFEDW